MNPLNLRMQSSLGRATARCHQELPGFGEAKLGISASLLRPTSIAPVFSSYGMKTKVYRVIYLSRINDVIYVLHCFEKRSREIPRNDAQIAKQRLKGVRARIAEERKHAKRDH